MITQYSKFSGLPTGLTLTKKLFTLADPDVVAYTSDSTSERTNAKGEYVFTFGEAAAISGDHTAIVFIGSTPIATGKRTFAGTNGETATTTPETVELDSTTQTQITAIETFATRMTTGLVQDGAVYQFTANMLELGPSGGGGGDATLAKQEEILDRLSEVTIGVTGYAQLDIYGVLQLKRGHTATLTFTSSTSNIVSDLSASTTKVFFGIKDAAGRSWLSIEGTKLVNTGLQSVRFTISAALAAAMINGEHFFDVVAVYEYNASNTPKYTSLEPFTSGRAKVTDLYVDI